MGADATDTSQRLRPRHAWASYVVLVVTLLMTAGVVYYVKHTAESKSRARFEGLARRTRDDIKRRLETYVALLRAGAGLLAASEQVSHEEFRAFVEQLDLGQRYQGIQGIGYAARVRPEELENFLAGARREFGRDFRLQPEHEREEYYPITYLEPRDRRNQAAVGYDMFSEPTRRAAMEQARDTGAPAASGKVTLVQELDEAGKQAGFLIYFPVYRNGRAPTTTAERRAAIRGFVYSPFRTDDLLRGIFGSDQTPQIAFRIYDGDRPDPHSLLHESHPPDASDAATNFTGIEQMEIEGRRWTLWYASRPNIESDIEHQLVPYLGLGGLAASLVLFGLTRAQARARSAAERAAGEVRSSEASLRASENRFRTMIEQSPVAITLFAPDGTMLQANRAWEKLWGVTAVQVAGYNVLRDRQLRAKGLIPLFERGFAGEAAALPPLNYDPSLTVGSAAAGRADAGRWVQAVIYPVKNPDGGVREVVLMQEDITERRRAEAEAIESEGRFRALSEATFDGIIVHEHDRIIEANPGFAQMFGYRLDELAGLCVPDLFAEESREVVRRNLAEDVAHPYEVTARRKDGTIFNLEVTGKEHVYRGRPVRVTAVRDITDRKLLEEQLRARALQLAEANRLKDEFLATLSHELRTPLTAILGWSRMLTMGALDAGAARRAIETIERNARAQARLIDELLDVSRIITGKLRLEVSEVSLCAVLEAAVEGVRPAAEAKGMGMKVHCEAADDRTAGDPARLQQVAWNLLSNAIKFTPRGGHIEARVRRVNDHLELRVSDTGEGVAAKFLPFIFDRFRQADGSITREHGGLGLGLSIVRHIVELHGGHVSAESAGPGRGTTFTARLPAAELRIGTSELRIEESASSVTKGGQRNVGPTSAQSAILRDVRALVVEDDEDTRQLLRLVLERHGADVLTAASAAEALDALRRSPPDVFISDIGMPREDGYALIRQVRALAPEQGGHVPAIALTAYARDEDRDRAIALGYDVHIPKPVDPETLVAVVARFAAVEDNGDNTPPPEQLATAGT